MRDPSAVKPPPAPSPPATRRTSATRCARCGRCTTERRRVVRRNPVADEPEAPAPPTIVCVADDDALDQILLVACDAGDRPGVLAAYPDVLASRLSLQLRYNEAAVVGRRSILVLEVRGARARRSGGRRRGGQGREAHPGRALGAVYPLPLDPRPPRRV